MFRTRKQPESNYSSVFINGKTIRIPLDKHKPITELAWPEFLDIALNSKCLAKCAFCYTDAKTTGINFTNIVNKIQNYFGSMELEQRPYQVALGGAGEPTLHPDFIKVLEAFHSLQITPNYTTNAMHLSTEIIEATKKYCGGVAVSLHPHLEKVWRKGIQLLLDNKIKTNVHIIISDKKSIDQFKQAYADYNGKIDYFVLLPYMITGRAPEAVIDFDYLEETLKGITDQTNIAFGSNFYEFLKKTKSVNVCLYPPEIMSKYLIMDDKMQLYNNSFHMKPVGFNKNTGVTITK